MDWSKAYHREHRASWEDIAESIRYSVRMEDVLALYAPSASRRGNRCPCPIHNGKDNNFSFTTQRFKCFVCGASGDTIEFVKLMCGYASRTDAMKRMNQDLNLRLPIDAVVSDEMATEMANRRQAAMAKQREHDAWTERYHALMDEYVRLDKLKREAEPMSDEWTEAAMNIDRVSYELDAMPPEPR